jgi:surface antigen
MNFSKSWLAESRSTEGQMKILPTFQLSCPTQNAIPAMKHPFVIAAVLTLSGCVAPTGDSPSDFPALSETAQSRRYAAFQDALEYVPGDRPVRWQVSPDLRGSVVPIDTIRSKQDGWCRSFEELIATGPKRYRLVGIACREATRRWLVLDVRPFTEDG